jgi:hypothetical protein
MEYSNRPDWRCGSPLNCTPLGGSTELTQEGQHCGTFAYHSKAGLIGRRLISVLTHGSTSRWATDYSQYSGFRPCWRSIGIVCGGALLL